MGETDMITADLFDIVHSFQMISFQFVVQSPQAVCLYCIQDSHRELRPEAVFAVCFMVVMALSILPETSAFHLGGQQGNGGGIGEILAAGLIVKLLQEHL
ncbi:hypothetical protein AVEN_80565-1 [Araneus ventricosus]|uniref:Uncharacterized protein n=1 Tax=Araneus ventricosus TaxID=182803 RepID=A0A4Y2CPZ0_ARAVE|nr:hypothetical protein AVEN_80565-1 [Araneus ventricosus]